jgi:hypothetical protein
MFRVGLYARVSTRDQQALPLQMRAMREYAAKRGWTIAVQIREVGSSAAERELREKLIAAARRREIDVVLVWRLDRWGRSLVDLVVTLKELAEAPGGFVADIGPCRASLTNQGAPVVGGRCGESRPLKDRCCRAGVSSWGADEAQRQKLA